MCNNFRILTNYELSVICKKIKQHINNKGVRGVSIGRIVFAVVINNNYDDLII